MKKRLLIGLTILNLFTLGSLSNLTAASTISSNSLLRKIHLHVKIPGVYAEWNLSNPKIGFSDNGKFNLKPMDAEKTISLKENRALGSVDAPHNFNFKLRFRDLDLYQAREFRFNLYNGARSEQKFAARNAQYKLLFNFIDTGDSYKGKKIYDLKMTLEKETSSPYHRMFRR